MKKFSKTPEMPKSSKHTINAHKRLNESMQLLFPRENIKSSSKQNVMKFLSKNGNPNTYHSKGQTLVSGHQRNDERPSFEHVSSTLTKTYSLNKTMLSAGTKISSPLNPQDNSVSPNKDIKSPRGTLTTIRKGQLPDSMVKMLGEYKGGYRDVEDFNVTNNCIMHHNKKAKFMVRGCIRSAGLCSKCAVKLAKDGYGVEELLIEDTEMTKKAQLETFLGDLHKVLDKYDNLDRIRAYKAGDYVKTGQKRINLIETLFKDLHNILTAKKQTWIDIVKSDIENVGQDIENYGRWINDNRSELNIMKSDIKSNYHDIIQKVDQFKFNEILNHFKEKLQEINICGDETSFREPRNFDYLDNKAIITQFDILIERLLTKNTYGGFSKANSKLLKSTGRYDNFVNSQTISLKPPTTESGVSIDFNKIEIDNIYFNYNNLKPQDSSFGFTSDALLSRETNKHPTSLGHLTSYKHSL